MPLRCCITQRRDEDDGLLAAADKKAAFSPEESLGKLCMSSTCFVLNSQKSQ